MKTLDSVRHLWSVLSFLCAVLAVGDSTFAANAPSRYTTRYDPRMLATLPQYCMHTQDYRGRVPGGNNKAEIDRWHSVMGETFEHMHHYCYGLIDTNFALLHARTQQVRAHYLDASVLEFDYVIERAPSNFVLLPEIFTKKGENLIRLGRAPQGVVVLQRATETKPDYWPPYAALSDYFKKMGDVPKAREWLEKGLAANPDVQALKTRLTELGGSKTTLKAAPEPARSQRAPKQPEQPAEPLPAAQPEAGEPPAGR